MSELKVKFSNVHNPTAWEAPLGWRIVPCGDGSPPSVAAVREIEAMLIACTTAMNRGVSPSKIAAAIHVETQIDLCRPWRHTTVTNIIRRAKANLIARAP